jgi:predicted transcriptional regulator
MAKPLSIDLRERVLAGESIRDIGSLFGISPSAVSK